jgi:LPXTG-motif cell wall-anchored protein
LPEGVGVLEVPGELRGEKCFPVIDGKPQARRGEADGRVYYCSNETFNLGSSQTRSFEFRVKIINATVGTGSVKAAGGTDESDPSNNTAKITYAGAAGGGDQNGDDGDDGDAGDDSAGAGGGTALPITGSASGVAAGLGLLLFTAGAGLYLMARRRRIRFTAGD